MEKTTLDLLHHPSKMKIMDLSSHIDF